MQASRAAGELHECRHFQMLRPAHEEVVFQVAAVLKAPTCILRAWYAFVTSLRVVNCAGGGGAVGREYTREYSIPQGCPLSMMWLSMVLTPLMRAIRQQSIKPRAPADDLNLFATGAGQWA
eukprot:5163567-Alexandrium_andersonii.AAC.1